MRSPVVRGRRTLPALSAIVLAVAMSAWGALALRPVGSDAAVTGAPAGAGAAFTNGTSTDGMLQGISDLQDSLRRQPTDSVGWATLGMDYVQQAKVSIDPSYYPKAEGVLKRSLALSAKDNFIAMAGMAALESARHDFTQALAWAQRAAAVDPYNSTVFGILGDAYTQLGRYPEAYQAIQRMVDLEPGTPSLARASYTWELRGNLPEATADMQRALDDASTPADRAFAHYYLGELAFNQGDARTALAQNVAGLREDPGYSPLLEGKAKAEAALGDPAAAVGDFTRVVSLVPQPEYVVELGELYQSLGNLPMAQQEYSLFRAEEQLFASNGVTLDTDPTLFNADHGDPAQALRYGAAGIKIRPFVEMDDAYAWALHRNGQDAQALVYSLEATGLGMRNALFYFHQGMIEAALGRRTAASADLTQALRINPHFNPVQAPVAQGELARLADKW
jgi:tetratricopeptide (TPR) repeat protein